MNYITVLSVLTVVGFANAVIPDFIQTCARTLKDPEYCLRNSIAQIIPKIKGGIPELNVPPMDPLPIPKLDLNRGPDSASLKATFTNIKVRGASDFIIDTIKPDLVNGNFDVSITLPHITFKGHYKLRMVLLLFQINGDGKVSGNFTNYKADVEMRGYKTMIDGTEHLQFKPIGIKIMVGKGKLRLTNLFNGDPVLSEVANNVITDNTKLFLDEITPGLEKAMSDVFTEIANNILTSASYDEMFPAS